MHDISKNWEGVFEFQYKVAIGQCEGRGTSEGAISKRIQFKT